MKKFIGKVISNKSNKTLTVLVNYKIKHHLYKKYVKKHTKCHVHDEKNLAKINDIVEIMETKPISKTKTWLLNKIINTCNENLK